MRAKIRQIKQATISEFLLFLELYPDLEIFKLNKSPNNWHALKDLLFQQVSYWFEMMLKDQSNITNSVTSWCVIPALFFLLSLYSYPTCYSPLLSALLPTLALLKGGLIVYSTPLHLCCIEADRPIAPFLGISEIWLLCKQYHSLHWKSTGCPKRPRSALRGQLPSLEITRRRDTWVNRAPRNVFIHSNESASKLFLQRKHYFYSERLPSVQQVIQFKAVLDLLSSMSLTTFFFAVPFATEGKEVIAFTNLALGWAVKAICQSESVKLTLGSRYLRPAAVGFDILYYT